MFALRFGPTQIELKVQRAGLVSPDGGVIEVACHRTIDVPHEKAHDLIVDLGAPHAIGSAHRALLR